MWVLEGARLSARLEKLQSGDKALRAIGPDPQADPSGKILALMRTWRQQRLDAIQLQLKSLADALSRGVESYDSYDYGYY